MTPLGRGSPAGCHIVDPGGLLVLAHPIVSASTLPQERSLGRH